MAEEKPGEEWTPKHLKEKLDAMAAQLEKLASSGAAPKTGDDVTTVPAPAAKTEDRPKVPAKGGFMGWIW